MGKSMKLWELAVAVTMLVAILTAQLGDVKAVVDFFAFDEFVYLAIFAWLALHGPGALSLDHLLAKALNRWLASQRVPAGTQ